jgi:O-antigen/teichoic acid export membrane protein
VKNSLLKNFFSSGLQAISVQVLGIVFFFIISKYLPKEDFGIINWATAISVSLTTLLSFGLDQVVVRRIAASKSSDWAATAYLLHTIAGSVITVTILIAISFFLHEHISSLKYLICFFAAQALIYIANPLKLFLNAKQNFTPYAVIAVFSNLIKIILAIFFITGGTLSIPGVYTILISCGILELISLSVYIARKKALHLSFKKDAYFKLIKEAFPQYISVIFDQGLARMDWILLGQFTTFAITAEYSFAYRASEIARVPITMVAPVILNLFARLLLSGNRLNKEKQYQVRQFYTIEIFGSVLLALLLNILWSPVVDYLFKGKYGTVNAGEFMVLSLCIPLMFVINLFWTLGFSAKKYRQISFITFLSALLNLILNLILIPRYAGLGAAFAFLSSTLLQLICYYLLIKKYVMTFSMINFLVFFLIAVMSFIVCTTFFTNIILRCLIAVLLYALISVVFRRINKGHLYTLRLFLKR